MHIRRAHRYELTAICELFDQHLGVDAERPCALARTGGDTGALFVAMNERDLLGAGTANILMREHAHEAFPAGQQGALVRELLADTPPGPVGLLNALVVAEHARGNGVGSALVAERMRWLTASGAASVLSFAWRHPKFGVRVAGALERNGMQAVAEVPGFWSEKHSVTNPCPHCAGSCTCTAVIYRDGGGA